MKKLSLLLLLAIGGCDVATTNPAIEQASGFVPSLQVKNSQSIDMLYEPLALAISTKGEVYNPEAVIPPQCYTKTEGQNNPCWACHTDKAARNFKSDWPLQREYAFSDVGLTNNWENLFDDYSNVTGQISDTDMLNYIREDNYSRFRETMERQVNYAGWVPDIDLHAGFDEEGFAFDGSWWRSFIYKPFLGTFFPTNGATDDIMIRLPKMFYTNELGHLSKEIYKINLAIVEATMTTDGSADTPTNRTVEPLDETIANVDLNGDGELSTGVTVITSLPRFYVGGAAAYPVKKNLYPRYTEFLHTVRYIDPDSPNLLSKRMKEVRYSIKNLETDRWSMNRYYDHEEDNKEEERLPLFAGNGVSGMRSDIGWKLQGFIEDGEGRLRAQTDQETYYCMGCHGNVGVTADQSFGFPRKVPGNHGWGEINLAGIPDVPQLGHELPEIMTYFLRNGGGDEFRNNDEVLKRFFKDGELNKPEVLKASIDGDKDIRHLIVPSSERAYALNKSYMALVKQQRFDKGRDPMVSMPKNVHKEIVEISAGLPEEKIFRDGTIFLDWRNTVFDSASTAKVSRSLSAEYSRSAAGDE